MIHMVDEKTAKLPGAGDVPRVLRTLLKKPPEPILRVNVEGHKNLRSALEAEFRGDVVEFRWKVPLEPEEGEDDAENNDEGEGSDDVRSRDKGSVASPGSPGVMTTDPLPTVKRLSIRSCPENLIIALNRFKTDFECEPPRAVKINDRVEFPLVIDMFPYTIEGRQLESETKENGSDNKGRGSQEGQKLAAEDEDEDDAEEEAEKANGGAERAASSAPSSCLYELCGITIHSGSVGGGHYFSYARGRDDDVGKGTDDAKNLIAKKRNKKKKHQWCRFDDETVTPWDIRHLERDCFGGAAAGGKFKSAQNAYMLYYRRISTSAEEGESKFGAGEQYRGASGPSGLGTTALPSELLQEIQGQNVSSQKRASLINMEYFRFVDNLLEAVATSGGGKNADAGESDSRLFAVVKFALKFTSGALVHAGPGIVSRMGPPKPAKKPVRPPPPAYGATGYSNAQSTHIRFESSDSDAENENNGGGDTSPRLPSLAAWFSRCVRLLQRCPSAAVWYLNHILELSASSPERVAKIFNFDTATLPSAHTTKETMARDLALEAVRICGGLLGTAADAGATSDMTVLRFASLVLTHANWGVGQQANTPNKNEEQKLSPGRAALLADDDDDEDEATPPPPPPPPPQRPWTVAAMQRQMWISTILRTLILADATSGRAVDWFLRSVDLSAMAVSAAAAGGPAPAVRPQQKRRQCVLVSTLTLLTTLCDCTAKHSNAASLVPLLPPAVKVIAPLKNAHAFLRVHPAQLFADFLRARCAAAAACDPQQFAAEVGQQWTSVLADCIDKADVTTVRPTFALLRSIIDATSSTGLLTAPVLDALLRGVLGDVRRNAPSVFRETSACLHAFLELCRLNEIARAWLLGMPLDQRQELLGWACEFLKGNGLKNHPACAQRSRPIPFDAERAGGEAATVTSFAGGVATFNNTNYQQRGNGRRGVRNIRRKAGEGFTEPQPSPLKVLCALVGMRLDESRGEDDNDGNDSVVNVDAAIKLGTQALEVHWGPLAAAAADASGPAELIGRRVRVVWDDGVYEGELVSYDEAYGKHLVRYDDGEEKTYNIYRRFGVTLVSPEEAQAVRRRLQARQPSSWQDQRWRQQQAQRGMTEGRTVRTGVRQRSRPPHRTGDFADHHGHAGGGKS